MKTVSQNDIPATKGNATASPVKFGIRFGNAKRGKIVKGMAVMEYLPSVGLDLIMCGPNGGECGKGGRYETTSTGVRSYHGGTRIQFGLTIY
jgi:hypothetical protein